MKRKQYILTILIFLALQGFCLGQRTVDEALKLRRFYKDFDILPDSGYIKSANIAIAVATTVLESIYGESIKKHLPLNAFLVDNETIWIVIGKKNKGVFGGTPYVEIRKKDGLILKVANSK